MNEGAGISKGSAFGTVFKGPCLRRAFLESVQTLPFRRKGGDIFKASPGKDNQWPCSKLKCQSAKAQVLAPTKEASVGRADG